MKEACNLFGIYQKAEMKNCNIILIFANDNDTSMYRNPIALSSLLKDKDTPSPRTFVHLINSSTPAQTLNYIVANKTQNSFCQHIYTTSLMNSNNFYLMNINAMVPRLGIKLTEEEYRILQQYLTSSHKTTFMNNMELKTA